MPAGTEAPLISTGIPQDTSRRSSDVYNDSSEVFRVSRDKFGGFDVPYLLQGANGPCPLLAICNVLLLRGILRIPDSAESMTSADLIGQLANSMIDRNNTENADDTLRSTLDKAVELLPSLAKGMDVDIHFTSVSGFEYTQEMSVFDLLDIHVYHGWIVSQDDLTAYPYVSPLTYNQAIVRVAEYEELKLEFLSSTEIPADKKQVLEEGEAIAVWLDHTSSQLTSDGIIELNSCLNNGDLAVLFRNNHFSTLYKQNGRLFALVTDIGFRHSGAMWESVDQLDGDVAYLNSRFMAVGSGGVTEADDHQLAMRLQYGGAVIPSAPLAGAPTVVVPRENVQVISNPPRRKKKGKCTIM
jgi:ubiquitin carboxyl-terminal hydrolase MINDY-1/2